MTGATAEALAKTVAALVREGWDDGDPLPHQAPSPDKTARPGVMSKSTASATAASFGIGLVAGLIPALAIRSAGDRAEAGESQVDPDRESAAARRIQE